jgi:hypothetical protein
MSISNEKKEEILNLIDIDNNNNKDNKKENLKSKEKLFI